MKKVALTATLILASLGLTNCATMSVEECKVANWQSVGYRDGKAGQDMDYLLNHAKACGKASITPDKRAWEAGRQQGLKIYCTADNAFALGKAGSKLNYVCPSDSMAQLQRYNENGLTIYRLKNQINTDTRERDKLIQQYKKLRNGENLDFETEKDARHYMLTLPDKINNLTQRINSNVAYLQKFG